MRKIFWITNSLVLGVVLGTVLAISELYETDFLARQLDGPRTPADGAAHVEVVGNTEYDFGAMDLGTSDEYTFELRNQGAVPVQLQYVAKSCSCLTVDLEHSSVPPGESTNVTIQWTPQKYAAEFLQSADLETSDPENRYITLVIKGRVTQAVRCVPDAVTINTISTSTETTIDLKIFGYRDQSLRIIEHHLENSETAPFIDVQFESLSPELLTAEVGARSGVLVKVIIQSGLPPGRFQQDLRLVTNVASVDQLIIPIEGTVKSDVSVIGKKMVDRDGYILLIGSQNQSEHLKTTFSVLVKGSYRQQTQLKIGNLDPKDVLQVSVGEPRDHGKVVVFPVQVEIPAGSRLVSRLGSESSPLGRIELETTHPEVKTLSIGVRFAVQQ